MSEQTKVTGIVLSVYPVGENDRRLTILTKERGKIQVFARGSRRPKHPLFGVTQPLIYCEFMVTDTRNYTYLNSAECKDYFYFLKKDLEDIYYSSYFAEVAEYFTMEGQDERNILNLLFVTFLAMKKKLISLSLIRRIYELKILQFAGFGLQSFQCVHCGNEEHLTRISFEEGGMLCSGCAVKGQGREVESAVLYVLQYVSSIPLNRLYSFTLKENIDKEHICCAMSGKQSITKKEWLKQRFDEGLVFYRSEERGKCFIEYIPAENAWVPIIAEGYLYINCLWIAGSMKGHGYSNDLLNECIRDAKAQNKKGICILSSEGRKKEFLSDPKYMQHKGFKIAETSDCGINLMYLPIVEGVEPPKFKECAKHPKIDEHCFVIYYTDQCPFTYYWVPRVEAVAKENNIPLKTIHITTKEDAQNAPSPVTTYALFSNGDFVTHGIQSDKKFLALAGIK